MQASIGIHRLIGGAYGTGVALGLFCLAGIWQSVGVWRSAGKSIKLKKKYLWPVLARLVAVFWLTSAIYFLYDPNWLLEPVHRLRPLAAIPSGTD